MTDDPTTEPPYKVAQSALPSGLFYLTNQSVVAHLYENCPHLYHGEPVRVIPHFLERVWREDIDRRGGVEQLRWCDDCRKRYHDPEAG